MWFVAIYSNPDKSFGYREFHVASSNWDQARMDAMTLIPAESELRLLARMDGFDWHILSEHILMRLYKR